jgi:hypothetical protein
MFKTPVPTFTLNGHSKGVPSLPGLCASIFLGVVTLFYIVFTSLKIGKYKAIFTFSQPNTVDESLNIEELYKMAFFVQNYHEPTLIYSDTSKIEWTAIIYENMDDGN